MNRISAAELSLDICSRGSSFSLKRDITYSCLAREELQYMMENTFEYDGKEYVFDHIAFEIEYEGDYMFNGSDEVWNPNAFANTFAEFFFVEVTK